MLNVTVGHQRDLPFGRTWYLPGERSDLTFLRPEEAAAPLVRYQVASCYVSIVTKRWPGDAHSGTVSPTAPTSGNPLRSVGRDVGVVGPGGFWLLAVSQQPKAKS